MVTLALAWLSQLHQQLDIWPLDNHTRVINNSTILVLKRGNSHLTEYDVMHACQNYPPPFAAYIFEMWKYQADQIESV